MQQPGLSFTAQIDSFKRFELYVIFRAMYGLRQHRIMGQGDSARDFDTSESMKNGGILDVFPIFQTARLGQKIRRNPQFPLCGVALISSAGILVQDKAAERSHTVCMASDDNAVLRQ